MNVYDFDKTIYDGDSTIDFYLFSIRYQPKVLIYFPIQIFGVIGYFLRIYNKVQFKEKFYIFLRGLEDIDYIINIFWEKNECKIKDFYMKNKKSSDVIISASPYFLLKPICSKLGIRNLIASNVNKSSGLYTGENCYGVQKVKEFRNIFPKEIINSFYSDSLSDEPMAKISEKSYIVKGNKIVKWLSNDA